MLGTADSSLSAMLRHGQVLCCGMQAIGGVNPALGGRFRRHCCISRSFSPKATDRYGELPIAERQLRIPKADHDGGDCAAPSGTLCREPTQVPEVLTADRR